MDGNVLTLIGTIVVALGGFLGTYISNRKSTAIWQYRLEQLEQKQSKHNNLIERTFILERRTSEQEKDLTQLKTDVNEVKTDVKQVKDTINKIKTDEARLEERINK